MLNLFCTKVFSLSENSALSVWNPSQRFSPPGAWAVRCRVAVPPAEPVQWGAGRGDSRQNGSHSGREGERLTSTGDVAAECFGFASYSVNAGPSSLSVSVHLSICPVAGVHWSHQVVAAAEDAGPGEREGKSCCGFNSPCWSNTVTVFSSSALTV